MSLVNRFLRKGRVRSAKRRLGASPTPKNYAELARECVQAGDMSSAVKICEEGLDQFPGNQELLRLLERTNELYREDHIRGLQRELRDAPRPGVWRELCRVLIQAGRVDRAEEVAEQWYRETRDGEARLSCAEARVERFFSDRRREDGLVAYRFLEETQSLLPRDPRPQRLFLQLTSRVGAWKDARRFAAQLLELVPGDPVLESRFRTLMSLAGHAPTFEQALREVERTGRLADEDPEGPESARPHAPETGSIRPLLQRMVAAEGVAAAIYLRGGTALVQGPKGATAERTARGVREVIARSQSASRRLGLGQPTELRLEGDFGTLLLSPGESGAAAMWTTTRSPSERDKALLRDLAGVDDREMEQA